MAEILDRCWFIGKPTAVYHSGDLGDIIYSLLWCRSQLGRIHLVLGPDPHWQFRHTIDPEWFEFIAPLLRKQPWIYRVDFAPSQPRDSICLNDFRYTWFSSGKRSKCLFQSYAEHFKTPALREDVAWLTAARMPDQEHPVVISRSPRYQNGAFPWGMIAKHYAGRLLFIGFKEEFNAWTRDFGNTAVYRPVRDALEMAQIIAGSRLFIGNQSFAMAVALGLGVPLIQEVCPRTPDCIFSRQNSVFWRSGTIDLPAIESEKSGVSTHPNSKGEFELGPRADSHGLGDYLSITPLAERLKNAVMLMPEQDRSFAGLFDGLCPVRFTESHPVFRCYARRSVIQQKLDLFGFKGETPLPVVRLKANELENARQELALYQNPIAFVPSCSKTWAHVRERPLEFYGNIMSELRKRFTILQFGRKDYPSFPGAIRMPFCDLRTLAAQYSVCGIYFGVDTGDYHLAVAVGCKALVMRPPATEGYVPEQWQHDHPNVRYVPFEEDKIIQQMNFL